MLHRVVNPFFGKGSPEDCQIVLQLAVLLERVGSKMELQTYADAHLGLDCNVFVGNYLFHILHGNSWRLDAHDDGVGPSTTITQIMSRAGGSVIHAVDEMVASRMYVLAEVDAQDHIIPGGPTTTPGHIVITEPGRYMPQFMTMDLTVADRGALMAPAFWGAESTGGIGLIQSWYAVTPLVRGGKDGRRGVPRLSQQQARVPEFPHHRAQLTGPEGATKRAPGDQSRRSATAAPVHVATPNAARASALVDSENAGPANTLKAPRATSSAVAGRLTARSAAATSHKAATAGRRQAGSASAAGSARMTLAVKPSSAT
jgi:hypothetical protein